MTISNGYSVDAYCDCEQCLTNIDPVGRWCRGEMISAAGETYAECAAEIKYHGWQLSRNRTAALAPGHKKPKGWGQ
ncbi:hypothetical protein R4T16_12215 [Citrobacter freundii]|uniref:hypothetical protein n=1 Tax=Citrobacter freundii TaxID=546 RepID=UPI0024E160AE|nr:hypothetical protein [Citrobacter freundii]WOR42011.1 hypothetical protein R4T16_12215 [Citrobacter freundii]